MSHLNPDAFTILNELAVELFGCGLDEAKLRLKNGRRIKLTDCPSGDEIPRHSPAKTTGRRTHSEDFRSVRWDGRPYTFTPLQAAIVRKLWEAWENGTPELSQDYLLTEVGSESKKLADLFKGEPAWGELIAPGEQRGTYRLAE